MFVYSLYSLRTSFSLHSPVLHALKSGSAHVPFLIQILDALSAMLVLFGKHGCCTVRPADVAGQNNDPACSGGQITVEVEYGNRKTVVIIGYRYIYTGFTNIPVLFAPRAVLNLQVC